MYTVSYRASFVRQYDRLEEELKEEVKEKLKLLRNKNNHERLRVHKLHGRFKKFWSFSVNYKMRIIFQFESDKELVIFDIGDHDVYK